MRRSPFALFRDLASPDRALLGGVLVLAAAGIACIYSAGSGTAGQGWVYALRQTTWCALAGLAYAVVVSVGYQRFLDAAYPLYCAALVLLCLTMFASPEVKGAQRMISLGFIRVQPSEFAKISLVLVLSKVLSRYPPTSMRPFLIGLTVGAPAVLMVLVQPDLGSALVYVVIIAACLFVAGTPMKYLLTLFGAGVASLPSAWACLREYQKMRLLIFLDPTRDPLGAGYNVIQSRIAVGSGSFWGKGFLGGLQSKLRFLPEPHTDFIFSVYAEEFGFIGSATLLLLFCLLFSRVAAIGLRSRDIRAKILTAGVTAWIWFQAFEGIGMSMGLMPVTGVPLPFLSYGGSSIISITIALALVGGVRADSANKYKT
ncbi:MAG: rod shape-determining protein RodA [Synergistaceae bacterium]|nr:rod shape-determining protein RodA [Synergistaceae bacterium]